MKLKYVRTYAGIHQDAALVLIGWLSFLFGALAPDPIVRTTLTAIARVLPKALYKPFIGANRACSSCISPVLTNL